MSISYSFILAFLMALIVGCSQFDIIEDEEVIQSDNQEIPRLRADEVIGHEVRQALTLANSTGTVGVVVEVSEGIVTLHGFAPNQGIAWQAEAVARSVQGVNEVYNQITLPGQ